jgi:hypothetical protein
MTEAKPLAPTRIEVTGLAPAAWLSGTMFLALLVLYFVGLDQGATSIRLGHTHSRVHPRCPALAGLSLPLIGREAVQDAADLADRLPMGGLEGHPRERRRSTDGQRSACRLDRVVARSAAARVEGCKAIGEAARQLEKRLAGLPAQLIEVDLRPFGQMIVERNDVQRTHTGQEVTGQLVHVQSKGSLARRAEYHRCPRNHM